MNTFDGYIRRNGTNSKVLLDGGNAKALSEFIGTISYANNKITYTKADGTSYDLINLSNYIYNLGAATSDNLGGIKIGFSQSGKNYPVQLDSNNKAYVYVPWEENSHYTTRLYVGDGTAENKITTNGNTKITVTDNNNVRNYITLIGSGATNISSDNNGKITINSTNTTYNTGDLATLNKGTNTEGKLWSAKTLVDYISDILGVDSTAITSLNTLIGQLHDNDTATGILVELAKKLNTPSSSIGSNNQPIYWNGSSFTTIGYTIEKSVPSSAVFTDTKYSFYVGENNNIKEHKNVSNPYFKLFENNTPTSIQIKAGTGISVNSDANGNITITNSNPDQNHNTDKTGIKLGTISGTKKTDSTVIINNSSTGLTIAGGTNKFSIGDGTNYIEIPITPSFTVTNKDTTIGTSLTTIATIAGTDIKAKIGSYLPLSGGALNGSLTVSGASTHTPLIVKGGFSGYRHNIQLIPARNWSGILFGANDVTTEVSSTTTNSYWVGNNNGAFSIAKGGSGNASISLYCNGTDWYVNTKKIYHTGNLPAYPTKESWNYDDRYLKLSTGGTVLGTTTFKTDSYGTQLEIYRNTNNGNPSIKFNNTSSITNRSIGFETSRNGDNAFYFTDDNATNKYYVASEEYVTSRGYLTSHYITHLYAGSGSSANAITTNGNTKLTITDDSIVRNSITIKGSGSTSVTSDANGIITIDSSDRLVLQRLTSNNTNYPLLFSAALNNNTAVDVTNAIYRNNSIYANPAEGTITAKLKGNIYGQFLRQADVETVSAARYVYVKLGTFDYNSFGTLCVHLEGNRFKDELYINYGSGNAYSPVVCGWYASHAGNVKEIDLVYGTSWNGDCELWLNVYQYSTLNIAVLRAIRGDGFTVNTAANWSATTTSPTFNKKVPLIRGMFGDLSGNASSASKLTTNAGSATQPVYFSGGVPTACSYQLNKTVPSNAVFTDLTVRQTLTYANWNLPLLLSYQYNTITTTNVDNVAFRSNLIYANPSTGTITANKFNGSVLELYPGDVSNYAQGIRIHSSNAKWTTLMFCGTDNTGTSGTSANSWSLHTYDGNFYINRNKADIATVNRLWGHSNGYTIGNTTESGYNFTVGGTSRFIGTTTTSHIIPASNYTYNIGSNTVEYACTFSRAVYARYLNASGPFSTDKDLYLGYDSTTNIQFYTTDASGNNRKKIAQFKQDGNVVFNNTVTASSFYSSSDIKLKNVISNPVYKVEDFANLDLVKYTWKDKDNKVHLGSIAQSVEKEFPELVNIDKDGYKSLDYSVLGVVGIISLAKEIIELKKEIKELKSKLYG